MRHLWSLVCGVVLAPVAFLLFALGAAGPQGQRLQSGTWGHYAVAGGAYALAAVLLGLLASLRISPAGPVAAGLVLVTVQVTDLVAAGGRTLAATWSIGGITLAPGRVTAGWLPLIAGTVLLMAAFSGQRWRAWPGTRTEAVAGPADPMVDTGRIQAISAWAPFTEEPAASAAPPPPN
jgi:choline-glycine betaine transporter